jgi:putative flippase GtrA
MNLERFEGIFGKFGADIFRYIKFVFGGGLALILNLIITYFLTEVMHLWHMVSFAIALGLELLFLLIYHTLITFKKKGKILLFVLIISFISTLNWILVFIMTIEFHFYYLISIVLVAGVVSIVNYFLNRNLVFEVS